MHDIRERAKTHLKASSGAKVMSATDASNRMDQNRMSRMQYSLWNAEGKFGAARAESDFTLSKLV